MIMVWQRDELLYPGAPRLPSVPLPSVVKGLYAVWALPRLS
jgi:hypothetical protein